MLTKTKILKHKLSELKREDQNIVMKDFYKDEVCFLFACGPSLADLDLNLFLENYSNYCIATVKQSFYKFENICDFNFFNLGNFTETKSSNTIFFGSSAIGHRQSILNCWKNQHVDVYDFISNDRNKENSLAYTRNFSDWKFENSLDRPWGPGIMYETVLYHLVHMGFKKIIVCGWDYAPKKQGVRQLSHFYNKGNGSGGLSFLGTRLEICFRKRIIK